MIPERMDCCNYFGKKSPQMIEWMAQAAPLRRATAVKKKNE